MENINDKIAVLCDMHLSADARSPQYAWLLRAVERMKADGIKHVVALGDLTAFGDPSAWQLYLDAVCDFEHMEIIGNSDIRNKNTEKCLESLTEHPEMTLGERRFIGLSTPRGLISENDFARLDSAKDGDVVCLHYYLDALKEPSKSRFLKAIEAKKLTVLHGHAHKDFDYTVGSSRVLGFRGLDPDKAIGGYPAIQYLTFGDTVACEEIAFDVDFDTARDLSSWLGVSCVNYLEDIRYAKEKGIRYIELRCDKKAWFCSEPIVALINAWRSETNGFLSVHMPNLSWKDGAVAGVEKWNSALEDALRLGADHLTVHPPRRTSRLAVLESKECFEALLAHYVSAVQRLPKCVTVGIENLHSEPGEVCDETRCFAYTPDEVTLWIEAINQALGDPSRVGHVLDVGHARNNGSLAKEYPISRWYLEMGARAAAYHIHQSVKQENGQLKNHKPIDSWFGPMINYSGFLWSWEKGLLNHAPVFLEVKGWENHEKSMIGFEKAFLK